MMEDNITPIVMNERITSYLAKNNDRLSTYLVPSNTIRVAQVPDKCFDIDQMQ